MNPELLSSGLLRYVVFLFSTTCHEAAHAYVAKRGGDPTAFEGGQVSLNPLPHIKREPFGMVVLPLLSLLTSGAMIGWASAPFNPAWQRAYPRRAAMMALAGPLANFTIAIIAGILLRIGIVTGFFLQGEGLLGIANFLDICFKLNLLLGIFNLLPFPPFDGYGVLGFFTAGSGAEKWENLRLRLSQFSFIGLLVGWQVIRYIYPVVENAAMGVFFAGLR